MALDTAQLKSDILAILDSPPESVETAANVWAQTIVDFAVGGEILAPLPGINPAGVPGPPPGKMSSSTAAAGTVIIEPIILASFKAQDPVLIGLQSGILAYIPTLAAWSGGGYTAAAPAVPTAVAAPGYFASIVGLGLSGAENKDIATLLSTLIFAAFSTALCSGAAVNPGGFISPITALPII